MLIAKRTLLSFVLFSAACDASRSVQLPNIDSDGAAFFVFSDAEHVQSVTPVQAAANLNSGSFALSEEQSQFSVEMYVFDQAVALEEAQAACGLISDAKSRFVCLRALQDCSELPSCLQVELSDSACKDRIELNTENFAIRRFREESKFLIEDDTDLQSHISELFFCGPRTTVDCPFRVPGFVISENGFFRCIAPSDQLSCTVSLDLRDCGLDAISAEISEAGTLKAMLQSSSTCVIQAPKSSDHSELGMADFVIVCGQKRYAATYADTLIGANLCPFLGPMPFDSDLDVGSELNALYAMAGPDNEETLILIGRGDNDCGGRGCYCDERDLGCVACCHDACSGNLLSRCIQRDELNTCAESPRRDCVNECLKFCDDPVRCSSNTKEGLAVVSMTPSEPYVSHSIVNLDPPNRFGRLSAGHQALAQISSDETKTNFAVIEESGLIFVELLNSKELKATGARIDFDFDTHSMLGWQDTVIVTGRTASATAAIAKIAQIRFSDRTQPSTSFTLETTALTFLDRIDFISGDESHLYLASGTVDSSTSDSEIYALDSQLRLKQSYFVRGQITGLASLNGEYLVVSVHDQQQNQDSVYAFSVDGGREDFIAPVIKGLRVRSMLAQNSQSRVFIGYEVLTGLIASQTGAVGLLRLRDTGVLELQAPFMPTRGGPVDTLALSLNEQTLYAVAAFSNWINRFQLYE